MRWLIALLLACEAILISYGPAACEAQAANRTGYTRQQIRSMHILDRPYRFGHVYGNTVRRIHYREHGLRYRDFR